MNISLKVQLSQYFRTRVYQLDYETLPRTGFISSVNQVLSKGYCSLQFSDVYKHYTLFP